MHIDTITLEFRKEPFNIQYPYFICADSMQSFTHDAMDTANLNQLYNQYREKYHIPFTEEIIALRQEYGKSATKMSKNFRIWC